MLPADPAGTPGRARIAFVEFTEIAAMEQQTGKYIVMAGVLIVLLGVIWYFLGHRLQWIGRLPGDVRIEREGFRFYLPLTTMILLSLLVSGILQIMRRFL
jgi:hypothetical protein